MVHKTKIAVCGDIMLDSYWYAEVSRMSPEAPVPVAAVQDYEDRLGGAANVANNLTKFGAGVDLYGVIGRDSDGDKITKLLKTAGICDFSEILDDFRTTKKLRVLSQNQHLLRCDFEQHKNFDIMKQSKVKKNLDSYDIVILSDYNKGVLFNCRELIEECARLNVPTIIDPKNSDLSIYAFSSVLKPNLREFNTLFSCDITETRKIFKALNDNFISSLVVTLGSKGVLYFNVDGTVENYTIPGTEVFDVTGAGDTFIAAFAYNVARKHKYSHAIRFANLCARSVVGKLGTSTLTVKEIIELEQFYEQHQ